jgi:hypothetical protein
MMATLSRKLADAAASEPHQILVDPIASEPGMEPLRP